MNNCDYIIIKKMINNYSHKCTIMAIIMIIIIMKVIKIEKCLFLNLIKMIKRTEIFLENLKSAEIL